MKRPSRVMLITWTGSGHVWPFINFAKVLRKRGMEISFVGFDADVERFRLLKLAHHSLGDDKLIRKQIESGTADEKTTSFEKVIGEIGDVIGKFKPDIIFIDPMSHISAVAALRAGVEARYLWVFNPPIRGDGHFPFCKVRRWREYLLLRKFPAAKWLAFWVAYQYQISCRGIRGETVFDLKVRPAAEAHGLDWLFTTLGYMIRLPSVVLGPQLFTDSKNGQVTHLGLGVGIRETEPDYDLGNGKKIVFVSFGSNFELYDGATRITTLLVSVAQQMSDYFFIFHVPSEYERPAECPTNVVFETHVPVLKILEKAAAVITHGGHGGVKESIFFRVPMLVVPFAFDQPGNAYHVEKSGVGLVLPPLEVSKQKVLDGLRELIENPRFRSNIEDLADRMRREDISVQYVDELEKHLAARRDS